MTLNEERVYLYLAWFIVCYRYSPPQERIAQSCGVSINYVDKALKRLAKQGYIKLYIYDGGEYEAKLMIDPTRAWIAVLRQDKDRWRLESEIPIQLHIFRTDSPVPQVITNEALITQELKNKGIKV